MAETLKTKTYSAMFWSVFERAGQQGIQFVISIILARMLLPAEFGLIGMLVIFMAVAQSFINSGFGQALIQKKDADQVDKSSIFYFNILVGILAAGVICLAAPWIASFYEAPVLESLVRVLSLTLVINAFGLVPTMLLTKEIDFKTQLKVSVIATVISGVIGITMAYRGFGVWSLAVQSVSRTLMNTIFLWFFFSWRPSWAFSIGALGSMFGFGSKLLLSSILNRIFENIYHVVIGKLFSAADLGFYTRAKQFQQIPVQNLSTVIGRVAFPVFSTVQDDKPRLKRGMRKALAMSVMVNFPMMIGLTAVARPLVLLLLTVKWEFSIVYLQLLCLAGMLTPLQIINLNVLTALGRSDLFFRLEILKKILIVISIWVMYRWGISAMIYGMIATSFLSYYLNCFYTGRLISYPFKEQVVDLMPYLGVSLVMGAGVYGVRFLGLDSNWLLLIVQILTGLLIYLALSGYFKLSAFVEMWQLGKGKLPGFKTA